MTSIAPDLADPRRVHAQLDRLAARVKGRRLDLLVQDGVRFAQLLYDRDAAVSHVAAALADGSYRPDVAVVARSHIHGKWREIARLGPLDLLAHGVLAEVLGERLEHVLSSRVYSYRVKRSPWQALRWLARVATMHASLRPDPKTRGLYVLRSDIKAYAPSIPLGEGSAIWPELRALTGLDEESPHWSMVRALITQELVTPEGEAVSRERGVLFGAPTSNALMNLYLVPLDEALLGIRGAYARFGDDVLFAHHDPAVVGRAKELLERVLAARELVVNSDKLEILYWNRAARPSTILPSARAVSSVLFLGASVGFDGTVALAPAKWRRSLRDLRGRLMRTSRALGAETPERRAKILASVVNEALDVRSELGIAHRQMLGDLVSDRRQLAALDYLLALWIAEASTGARGPAAFRRLPYAWIRRRAKLVSRVVVRNRGA